MEKQIFINVDEWLETTNTNGERELIKKYMKSKWYNEKEYNDTIKVMTNDANKNYDYNTWYTLSYYLDFEDYYNELSKNPENKNLLR